MTAVLVPDRHAMDDWVKYARCNGHPNVEWWFPPREGDYTNARPICRGCPVRVPCLVQGIKQEGLGATRSQRHGMQGGTTPTERMGIARKLRTVALAAWGPVLVGILADLDHAAKRFGNNDDGEA